MKITVVVVDDEEIDRYLVKRIVARTGIDTRFAEFADGKDFVDVLRDTKRRHLQLGESPPAILVLLDINMPRMGGLEVLDTLATEFEIDEQLMFVTMYTSSNHAEDRADSDKYEFVKDYIVKPLTSEALEGLIQKLY